MESSEETTVENTIDTPARVNNQSYAVDRLVSADHPASAQGRLITGYLSLPASLMDAAPAEFSLSMAVYKDNYRIK
ncbi:hypothetical protein [Spirosoma harenae]